MDKSSAERFENLQKPLEHFRAKTKRLKTHPLEIAIVWVACAQLVFQPWAIGGMRPWSQFIGLGLSVLAFGLALLPRNYTEDHSGSNSFRLIMWPKLVRFPLFWIGLVFLIRVLIQALNPSREYQSDGAQWWIANIPHYTWLPAGLDGPFVQWPPWRMLLIYGSIWLTICAIWVGFSRRRSLQMLFITLAVNGVALAIFGVAQKFAGNGKIFWFYKSVNPAFFASFVYKNHAGMYLNLALAVTCGLAAWYYMRAQRRLEKSNPSGVFAFFATCIAVAILTSYARGATLMMLAFLAVCLGVFAIRQLIGGGGTRRPIIAIVMIVIFGWFLKTGLDAIGSKEAWHRMQSGFTGGDTSLLQRQVATKASIEMLRDTWPEGIGAGGFRFLFPKYQIRYPELEYPKFWENAHNDLVQIPIEQGLAGVILIIAGLVSVVIALIRAYFWENPLSFALVFGCALLVVYAWWDFPCHNPAVLLTWCVLLVTAAMWAKFEESNA